MLLYGVGLMGGGGMFKMLQNLLRHALPIVWEP